MIVTHRINMDLVRRGVLPFIDAVQDDKYTRNVEISLYAEKAEWEVPDGSEVIVRYCKADGKGGEYDTLPDGSSAYSINGNAITVALAPQVLTAAGLVEFTVGLINAGKEISTFSMCIRVSPNVVSKLADSENYSNVTGFLPMPPVAQAGQYFKVAEVDGAGRVLSVEATNAPSADWDMLKNRPFYENIYTSECSFTTPPEALFDAMGYTWWKISDLTPTKEQILSTVFTFNSGGATVSLTPVETEFLITAGEIVVIKFERGFGIAVCYAVGEVVVDYDGNQLSVAIPQTGIYFAYATGETISSDTVIGISYADIKLLDPKFLPNSASTGLPQVTTDDNGKFLRVVDGVWTAAAVESAEEGSF